MSNLDLDELDRLHAALPELEPAAWMSHEDDGGAAIVIATVMCEDDSGLDVAEERAKDAGTILRAYPALAAEIRALRADLARVSEEMGIPSGIGPAPGEIRRLVEHVAERDAGILALREVAEAARAFVKILETKDHAATVPRKDRR